MPGVTVFLQKMSLNLLGGYVARWGLLIGSDSSKLRMELYHNYTRDIWSKHIFYIRYRKRVLVISGLEVILVYSFFFTITVVERRGEYLNV